MKNNMVQKLHNAIRITIRIAGTLPPSLIFLTVKSILGIRYCAKVFVKTSN